MKIIPQTSLLLLCNGTVLLVIEQLKNQEIVKEHNFLPSMKYFIVDSSINFTQPQIILTYKIRPLFRGHETHPA